MILLKVIIVKYIERFKTAKSFLVPFEIKKFIRFEKLSLLEVSLSGIISMFQTIERNIFSNFLSYSQFLPNNENYGK